MSRVCVVGATGFVGQHLVTELLAQGHRVYGVSRKPLVNGVKPLAATLADGADRWVDVLGEIDCIYYVAGLAHEGSQEATTKALMRQNSELPLRVFQAARRAHVKCFVWLSSAKVLGDRGACGLNEAAMYAPGDAYAQSKVAGERVLLNAARSEGSTQLVIVRPPLVYGAGVRANFLTLLRWVDRGWPLPVKGACAPRSLVSIANLVDFLVHAASDYQGIAHVADAQAIGVAQLYSTLAQAMNRPSRNWFLPPSLLRVGATALGRLGFYQRLFEPLVLDCQLTCSQANWQPPYALETQLEETVRWYLQVR